MLELENLHVAQGSFALRCDTCFGTGLTAVLGPSGAGKSTLLNAIAGFVPMQAGQIRWHDQDITALSPASRPVAMIFQDNNLFPHLTLAENLSLALGMKASGRIGSRNPERIGEALAQVELAGFEARKPAQLSGGQQSRAALARVLLQDRPVLLLDEPFAALGPALKRDMLDLVARVCRDHRLVALMVSHDPEDALRICPQSVVVADGTVSSPAPTEALLQAPPAALQHYLGR